MIGNIWIFERICSNSTIVEEINYIRVYIVFIVIFNTFILWKSGTFRIYCHCSIQSRIFQ